MNTETAVPKTPPTSTDDHPGQNLPQTPFPLSPALHRIFNKRNTFYTQTILHQQEANPLKDCYNNENNYYSQYEKEEDSKCKDGCDDVENRKDKYEEQG